MGRAEPGAANTDRSVVRRRLRNNREIRLGHNSMRDSNQHSDAHCLYHCTCTNNTDLISGGVFIHDATRYMFVYLIVKPENGFRFCSPPVRIVKEDTVTANTS